MKKYKTITRMEYVTKLEKVEEKVPVWWYKFLLWLFNYEKSRLDSILNEERKHAWDKGFDVASRKGNSTKAKAMEDKLAELGYEVRCNFPMARQLNPDMVTQSQFDPAKAWDVIKVSSSKKLPPPDREDNV